VQPNLAARFFMNLAPLRGAVGLQGDCVGPHDNMMLCRHPNADREHGLCLSEPVAAQFFDHECGEGDRPSAA
jgi:hypothetical protein